MGFLARLRSRHDSSSDQQQQKSTSSGESRRRPSLIGSGKHAQTASAPVHSSSLGRDASRSSGAGMRQSPTLSTLCVSPGTSVGHTSTPHHTSTWSDTKMRKRSMPLLKSYNSHSMDWSQASSTPMTPDNRHAELSSGGSSSRGDNSTSTESRPRNALMLHREEQSERSSPKSWQLPTSTTEAQDKAARDTSQRSRARSKSMAGRRGNPFRRPKTADASASSLNPATLSPSTSSRRLFGSKATTASVSAHDLALAEADKDIDRIVTHLLPPPAGFEEDAFEERVDIVKGLVSCYAKGAKRQPHQQLPRSSITDRSDVDHPGKLREERIQGGSLEHGAKEQSSSTELTPLDAEAVFERLERRTQQIITRLLEDGALTAGRVQRIKLPYAFALARQQCEVDPRKCVFDLFVDDDDDDNNGEGGGGRLFYPGFGEVKSLKAVTNASHHRADGSPPPPHRKAEQDSIDDAVAMLTPLAPPPRRPKRPKTAPAGAVHAESGILKRNDAVNDAPSASSHLTKRQPASPMAFNTRTLETIRYRDQVRRNLKDLPTAGRDGESSRKKRSSVRTTSLMSGMQSDASLDSTTSTCRPSPAGSVHSPRPPSPQSGRSSFASDSKVRRHQPHGLSFHSHLPSCNGRWAHSVAGRPSPVVDRMVELEALEETLRSSDCDIGTNSVRTSASTRSLSISQSSHNTDYTHPSSVGSNDHCSEEMDGDCPTATVRRTRMESIMSHLGPGKSVAPLSSSSSSRGLVVKFAGLTTTDSATPSNDKRSSSSSSSIPSDSPPRRMASEQARIVFPRAVAVPVHGGYSP